MNKLKVGIVGTTRGADFYNDFNMFNNVKVTSVMDTDHHSLLEFKNKYNVENIYSKYDDLLNSNIDIVVLASPINLHAKQAIAALNKNIHVLSEVTAATTLEDCKLLFDAVKRSKAQYMMAENYCYIRENVAINNMIKKGLFGEIYFAEGEYIHNVKYLHYDNKGNPTWRRKETIGKRGCTYGTHSLGPILDWFDEKVKFVNCLGSGTHTVKEYENDDTTVMLCQTEKGSLIKIRLDMVSNRPHNMGYYSLQGTKGCYESPRIPGQKHKVWLEDYSENSEEWINLEDIYHDFLPEEYLNMPVEPKDANHWGADYFMIKDFIDSITNNKPVTVDIYKALEFTIPGILSEESINSKGQAIEVPNIKRW